MSACRSECPHGSEDALDDFLVRRVVQGHEPNLVISYGELPCEAAAIFRQVIDRPRVSHELPYAGGYTPAPLAFSVAQNTSETSAMRSIICCWAATSIVFFAAPAAFVARQKRSWRFGNCSTCFGSKKSVSYTHLT